MSDDQTARLARIETTLDTMSAAIITLTRVEERVFAQSRRMDSFVETQKEHGKRIATIEPLVGSNKQSLHFAERLFWILASGAIAFAFAKMNGA